MFLLKDKKRSCCKVSWMKNLSSPAQTFISLYFTKISPDFYLFFSRKKKVFMKLNEKNKNIFKVKIFFPCEKPHLHFIFLLKLFHPVFHETKIIILHIVPLGLTKKKKFSWEKNQKNRRIFFPSEKRSSCQNLFLNSVSSDFFPTSLFLQDVFSFPSVKKRS